MKMKRYVAALASAAVLLLTTGCTYMIKTPVFADYDKLDLLNQSSTRNDVEKMLGAPQGVGLHYVNGKTYDLALYFGTRGEFSSLGTARLDYAMALISFEGDRLANMLYYRASAKDEVTLGQDIPIKKITEKLVLGKTDIRFVHETMGKPRYRGRLINKENNTEHRIVAWDSSKMKSGSAVKERRLIIGYDGHDIIRDIIWASSMPEDIAALGEVRERYMRKVTTMTPGFILPDVQLHSIDYSTKIDPVQIDAVLNDKPKNVKALLDILGKPTALGINSLQNFPPLVLSNWTYSKFDIKGVEEYVISKDAPLEEQERLWNGQRFLIVAASEVRLYVGHDEKGDIKEIIWFKPYRDVYRQSPPPGSGYRR